MFTDQPVTPARLEVFVDLVSAMKQRKLDRDAVRKLMQPKGLPGLTERSDQASVCIKAATELILIREDEDQSFRPSWNTRRNVTATELVLEAIDEKVLSATDVEPWFARFYAYVIAQSDDAVGPGSEAANNWVTRFNDDVCGGKPAANPFNVTKYNGLRRWLRYAGLGWHDSNDNFIPCPYDRLTRKLPGIFGGKRRLSADDFMAALAIACPELDGGSIFNEVNSGFTLNRTCTRAMAIALRDLHDGGAIKLECPPDNRGWSLINAGVIRNAQEGLQADEFDYVELLSTGH